MYFNKLIAGFAREKQFKPEKCGRKLCSLHYNLKLINLDICHFQQSFFDLLEWFYSQSFAISYLVGGHPQIMITIFRDFLLYTLLKVCDLIS